MSNQLGIALAYAVGAGLVKSDAALAAYARFLAALELLLALGAVGAVIANIAYLVTTLL